MAFNKREALKKNYGAIKAIFDHFKDKTELDKEVLKHYIGYGAIKEILLDPYNEKGWNNASQSVRNDVKSLFDLINSYYEDRPESAKKMIESLRTSTLTSYYTDSNIINASLSPLKKLLPEDINVLDPSCGSGAYIGAVQSIFKDAQITGVEKEGFVATLAAKLYDVKVHPDGLEKLNQFLAPGEFDLICSNIPFGDYKIYDNRLAKLKEDKGALDSMAKIHNYFFVKALELTKSEGIVSFITSNGVMDSDSAKTVREHLMENAELVGAYRLPDFVFKNEAGTETPSDLIVLRKRENPVKLELLSQNEKAFISSKGEVNGVKVNEYYELNKPHLLGEFHEAFLHNRKTMLLGANESFQNNVDVSSAIQNLLEKDVESFLQKKMLSEPVQDMIENMIENKEQIKKISIESEADFDRLKERFKEAIDQGKVSVRYNAANTSQVFISLEGEALQRINIKPIVVEKKSSSPVGQLDLFSSGPPEEKEYKLVKAKPTQKSEVVFLTPEELGKRTKGEIFFKNGVCGIIDKDYGNKLYLKTDAFSETDSSTGEKVELFNSLKDVYGFLIDSETSGDELSALDYRNQLNVLYDKFVEKYGNLTSSDNTRFFSVDTKAFMLFALEIDRDGTIQKSDILLKSTFTKEGEKEINTIEDGIFYSLNVKGRLDLDVVAQKLSMDQNQVLKEGQKKGLIYPNPIFPKDFNFINPSKKDFNSLETEYVTKDVFLSGSVGYKERFFEIKGSSLYSDQNLFKRDKELLSEAKPQHLTIDMINPSMGELWINEEIYQDFVREVLEDPEAKVTRVNSLESWKIKAQKVPSRIHHEYAIKCYGGRTKKPVDILQYAINKESPIITYKDSKNVQRIDLEAVENVNRTIEEFNQKFRDYIFSHPEYSDYLEKKYNALFNREIKREFNGEHLVVPGLNKQAYVPYKHQLDAVWQLVQNHGGLCDHKVGAGKSLVIAMSSQEMKRLGVAKKSMAICLKANADAIYNDYVKAYPRAKVLKPSESDFTPAKRKELFYKIANNDWDCVIITHDQFKSIPQSPEIQEQILKEELRNVEDDLKELFKEEGEPSRMQLKGLEKRKLNLEANLERVYDSIKRDEGIISFDKMGIDNLFVDESHYFKNLAFTTRHKRLAGLGSPEGSQKATNLLMACRTLQNMHGADKGITFLTGTSISNSLVELYSMFKYLAPEELAKRNISNFDSWASVFAEASQDLELSVTNQIKLKTRFRTFVKVPELVSMYTKLANVVNDNNYKVARPGLDNVFVKIKATPEQIRFSEDLIRAVQTEDFSIVGKSYDDAQLQAKMLLATNLSAKAAIDMRMVDPLRFDEHSGSKLYSLADNVIFEYNDSSEYKGTQLVFCDLGVPGTKTALESIDFYQEIKKELIKRGVKAEEIAFIHDYSTSKKKSELHKKVNAGDIRVVIGSTVKMGVGNNFQKRVIAMHEIDCPWRPSDLEQREGRGARQQNWAAEKFRNNLVKNYFYATERSLDGYKYFLVDLKRKFIDQIKNGSITKRVIRENEGEDMSMVNFIAQVSGNKDVLELSKIEKKLDYLKRKDVALKNLISLAKSTITRNENSIISQTRLLDSLSKDKIIRDHYFSVKEIKSESPEGVIEMKKQVSFTMTIDGTDYNDMKEMGEALNKKLSDKLSLGEAENEFVLGNVGSFKLVVNIDGNKENSVGFFNSYEARIIENDSFVKYGHGNNQLSSIPGNAARYIYDCLAKIEKLQENVKESIESSYGAIEGAKKKLEGLNPKEFEAEMKELNDKQRQLKVKIEENNALEDTLSKGSKGVSEPEPVYAVVENKSKGVRM